jgi:hypothetical protein
LIIKQSGVGGKQEWPWQIENFLLRTEKNHLPILEDTRIHLSSGTGLLSRVAIKPYLQKPLCIQ